MYAPARTSDDLDSSRDEPTIDRNATMRAAVRDRYGPPDVVEVREIERPLPADDEVRVRVRASSVNPVDWHTTTGTPYLVRGLGGLRTPKSPRIGVDFAGIVEAVGRDVAGYREGDEVFGVRLGAFAEYVCVKEAAVAPKPATASFERAAAVPVAGITALQALRDKGRVRPGQRVLINGASGGVGTFAVQVAKAFGAEVTAVCSTRNVDLLRSLGADHVVDYTEADFTRGSERYDLMLDIAGGRSWADCTRVLTPSATVVLVGGPKPNRLTGLSLRHLARARLGTLIGDRTSVVFLASITPDDLVTMSELLEAGNVTPTIDRRYPLDDVAAALRYLGEGHARGKVVVTVRDAP